MNEFEDKSESDELKGTGAQFKRSVAEAGSQDRDALPRLMLVTLRESMRPDFASALEAALRGGARLIQLRESPGNPGAFRGTGTIQELARTTSELCAQFGARWVWNGLDTLARSFSADGVHLPERMSGLEIPHGFLRGASVHSLEATERALTAGADYLIFGSIWETASHPGGVPGGMKMLRDVCEMSPVPVYAIGGVTARRAPLCQGVGAYGVAVMRAVWDAPDVEAATRELVAACERG